MKIIVDEDLPRSVVDILKDLGFESIHARDLGLGGKPDRDIFSAAQESQAALLSANLAFGNTQLYPAASHQGIILLRFPDYSRRDNILRLTKAFFSNIRSEDLVGALVVVEPGSYRIRRR